MIDKERLAQKMFHVEHYAERCPAGPAGPPCGNSGGLQPEGEPDGHHQPGGIEDRHFADSLLFAAQPEVTGKLVDVGTGAGFPGVAHPSATKLF